jgi:phosphoribosylformylglycinamidine cyclo-ligase
LPNHPLNAGKMLLSPTRSFSPLINELFSAYFYQINGMVHCTGGGQTKILHFINNLKVVKNNLFNTPPLFSMIQEQSQTPWREMYSVFNMGSLLEIYTDEKTAFGIIAIANRYGIDAQIIGYVEEAEQKSLIINSKHGVFVY